MTPTDIAIGIRLYSCYDTDQKQQGPDRIPVVQVGTNRLPTQPAQPMEQHWCSKTIIFGTSGFRAETVFKVFCEKKKRQLSWQKVTILNDFLNQTTQPSVRPR